ncbi:MAG: 4a-hydroxytetrahydrobiopterin dehydratase [Chloroflexia bacterium]|nr:4a-hydroxytetrahydrobiopterin dehydratase [Chloroflexia bacterium]
MPLVAERCEACQKGAPTVELDEQQALLREIPEWAIVEVEGVPHLRRVYSFKNFAGALAFTQRVGAAAEEEGHHPSLLTEWGKTTVSWWTHKIGGLHRNDFIMAAKSDELYPGRG